MKRQLLPLFLLLLAMPAYSHHSYQAAFDNSKKIKINGTISDISWKNPHIEFIVETISDKGIIQKWIVPTAAPGVAQSNNLNQGVIVKGDSVTFTGWPARDGSYSMRALVLTVEDGTSYQLRPDRNSRRSGRKI